MENPTSFDLNHAIQRWRENLDQSPAFRSENLAELESHLHDSVAALQTRGLSAEESFMVAVRRIGKSNSLTTEFAKVNGQVVWLDRALWVMIGSQLWLLTANVSFILYSIANAMLGKLNALLPFYWVEAIRSVLSTTLAVLAFPVTVILGAMVCWRLVRRLGTTFSRLLRRPIALAVSYASLCVFVSCSNFLFGYMELVLKKWNAFEGFNGFSGFSGVLIVVHAVVLAVLMSAVARKRLSMCQAIP